MKIQFWTKSRCNIFTQSLDDVSGHQWYPSTKLLHLFFQKQKRRVTNQCSFVGAFDIIITSLCK